MLAPDTTEGVAGAPTFGTIMLIKHLSNPKGRQEPGNSVPSDRPRATSGPCSVHSRRSRCAPIPPPCRSKRVRQGPLLPSIFCRAGSFASSDGQKLPVVTGDARLQRDRHPVLRNTARRAMHAFHLGKLGVKRSERCRARHVSRRYLLCQVTGGVLAECTSF